MQEGYENNFGFLIHDVARLMRTAYDRRMKPLGLTRSQWWVLNHLFFHQGISQSDLAKILDIERATLGRLLDRLAVRDAQEPGAGGHAGLSAAADPQHAGRLPRAVPRHPAGLALGRRLGLGLRARRRVLGGFPRQLLLAVRHARSARPVPAVLAARRRRADDLDHPEHAHRGDTHRCMQMHYI